MSSFAALVGHAASGFEATRQQDLQRQFADEQGRRAMASDFLQKIAFDPNQKDDVRNASLQSLMQVAQLGPNQKFSLQKHIQPVYDLLAKYHPAAQGGQAASSQPPPPPPGLGIQGLPPVNANAPALTAGGSAPPQTGVGPAQQLGVSTPAPSPTASQQMMGGQSYTPQLGTPPPPPPDIVQAGGGILAGPAEIAKNAATMASAQAGGSMQGQIAARQAALGQMPGLPPELQAGLVLGVPMYRTMNQTVGAGGGYAGELRSQGEPVPATIPDNQWVNLKELGSGRKTYEPGPAPGEKAGGDGTLITQTEQAQRNASIRYGYWQKENNTQFGQRLTLQDRGFQNAILAGDYKGAKNIVFGADKDYQQAVSRMHTMDQNYDSALKGDQQAQLSLLANHLGMTAGAQKGMRINRSTMEEAMQSAPKTQTLMAKFFHQDANGDYVFDGWKGGVNLTQDQMKQMVDLAHQKVNVLRDTVDDYHNNLRPELTAPAAARGEATASPKKNSGGPPKPPASVRPPLESFQH